MNNCMKVMLVRWCTAYICSSIAPMQADFHTPGQTAGTKNLNAFSTQIASC